MVTPVSEGLGELKRMTIYGVCYSVNKNYMTAIIAADPKGQGGGGTPED